MVVVHSVLPTWTIFPWAGSLAYIAIELIPAMFQTRGARRVRSELSTIVDPERNGASG